MAYVRILPWNKTTCFHLLFGIKALDFRKSGARAKSPSSAFSARKPFFKENVMMERCVGGVYKFQVTCGNFDKV